MESSNSLTQKEEGHDDHHNDDREHDNIAAGSQHHHQQQRRASATLSEGRLYELGSIGALAIRELGDGGGGGEMTTTTTHSPTTTITATNSPQILWSIIESSTPASSVPLTIIQDACQRYPDQVRYPYQTNHSSSSFQPAGQACENEASTTTTTLFHRACERGISPDVLQYLLNLYPEAVRQTNQENELPIHTYLGYCLSMGIQPDVTLIETMLQHYPQSCIITLVSDDRDCPLNESFQYQPEIIQCFINTFLQLHQDEDEGKGELKMLLLDDLIIPQETYIGDYLQMSQSLATMLVPLLPYCKRIICQIQDWTPEGFITFMKGLATTMKKEDSSCSILLEELHFDSFPSHLVARHRSAQDSMIQALDHCGSFLQHLSVTCPLQVQEVDEDEEDEEEDDFTLFCRGMKTVLPHVSKQTTFDMKDFVVETSRELCHFLTTMAPPKTTFSALMVEEDGEEEEDEEEDGGGGNASSFCSDDEDDHQEEAVTPEELDSVDDISHCRIEQLSFQVCTIPQASLVRILKLMARVPSLKRLALDLNKEDVGITDALVTMLKNRSPVQQLVVGQRGLVNHSQLLQTLNNTNNTSLYAYQYCCGEEEELKGQDHHDYIQIKYLTLLNKYGREKLRDASRTSRCQVVDLVWEALGASDSDELTKFTICYGLLRETPHLWSP